MEKPAEKPAKKPAEKQTQTQDQINVFKIATTIYGKAGAEAILAGRAKDLPHTGFEEPLPDLIGYKQHGGECPSDTLQEVFMFADGIREYTQPMLYGLTPEQMEVRVKLLLEPAYWKGVQEYLYYIQRRFRVHYDVINYLRTHRIPAQKRYQDYDEVCVRNPLFKQKEITSLEASVLALKHLKGEKVYKLGQFMKDTLKTATNLVSVLGIPYAVEVGLHLDAAGVVIEALAIDIEEDHSKRHLASGHVFGFIKVLGHWHLYDDNYGFTKSDEEVLVALADGRALIVNYGGRAHFVLVQKETRAFEAMRVNGAWNKGALSHLLLEDGKYRHGLFMYDPLPRSMFSIRPAPVPALNEFHTKCGITEAELHPTTVAQVQTTVGKHKTYILANTTSNSKVFENLYEFAFRNLDLATQDPEVLAVIQSTSQTVVNRSACTPMIHYWAHKIQRALGGKGVDALNWFEALRLKQTFASPVAPNAAHFAAMREEHLKEKLAEKTELKVTPKTPVLVPCLPGQIRDPKTKECKDRKVPSPPKDKKDKKANETKKAKNGTKDKNGNHGTQKAKKEKKETKEGEESEDDEEENGESEGEEKENEPVQKKRVPCPKGEQRDRKTGECVKKLDPCPEGEVRDRKTKECVKKLVPCAEDEVRDRKTKECVKKLVPCGPGEVRNAKTKKCRPRFEENPCPPGQVWDEKAKACRTLKQFVF